MTSGLDSVLLEHIRDETTMTRDAIGWFLALYDDEITATARREAGSRHYIHSDDVAQAIRIAVNAEWKQFKSCERSQVIAMFKRRARQYIDKEVTDYMHFTGAYIYTPAQVRHHLEASAWSELISADIEARTDIYQAWSQLSPVRKRAVYRRYALDMQPSEVPEAERKACNRGIDDMAVFMNKNVPNAVNTEEDCL